MDREPNSFPSAERERDSAKPQETTRERDSAKPQETTRERDSAKPQETAPQVRGMHHHAFRSCDIEKTRKFYEEVIGLPLIATFVETDNPLYKDGPSYIHVFFELGDGSCLAFFQFQPNGAPTGFAARDSFDHHIALEVDGIEAVQSAERRYKALGLDYYIHDHGYVYSIYTRDPNGMIVELTTKVGITAEVMAERRPTAHADLKKWLEGTVEGNNRWRNE